MKSGVAQVPTCQATSKCFTDIVLLILTVPLTDEETKVQRRQTNWPAQAHAILCGSRARTQHPMLRISAWVLLLMIFFLTKDEMVLSKHESGINLHIAFEIFKTRKWSIIVFILRCPVSFYQYMNVFLKDYYTSLLFLPRLSRVTLTLQLIDLNPARTTRHSPDHSPRRPVGEEAFTSRDFRPLTPGITVQHKPSD